MPRGTKSNSSSRAPRTAVCALKRRFPINFNINSIMLKQTVFVLGTVLALNLSAGTLTNAPTYVKDVRPIVMTKCFTCHHPGSLLPDWTDYKVMYRKRIEVKRRIWDSWETDITRHYYNQPMPAGYGREALTITKSERELIKNWVEAGAPYGVDVVVSMDNTNTGWIAPVQAAKVTNPLPSNEDTLTKGKSLYVAACLPCHGQYGKGDGVAAHSLQRNGKPIAPANLSSPSIQAQSDGSLFWKMREGRSPMPSWKAALTEEQCWQLVAYIRTLSQNN